MKTVVMRIQTRYNEKPVRVGEQIQVDDYTAQRWAGKTPPLCELLPDTEKPEPESLFTPKKKQKVN